MSDEGLGSSLVDGMTVSCRRSFRGLQYSAFPWLTVPVDSQPVIERTGIYCLGGLNVTLAVRIWTIALFCNQILGKSSFPSPKRTPRE